MDGRGGCCIARYGGSSYNNGHYGLSKADRIMLRFRPIAPKPSNNNNGEKNNSLSSSLNKNGVVSDVSVKSGRGKRKYHKEASKRCIRKKKSELSDVTTSFTLSLLPEKHFLNQDLNFSPQQKQNGPFWLCFNGNDGGMLKTTEISRRTVVVSSCVTVERVTDAWIDDYGLGKIDEEKKMNLMRDTCPGFISDGLGNVTWTNEAYKKMAKEDINVPVEKGAPEEINYHVIVRLVMKERPMLTYTAFTCRVRLQYTCQDRERGSVTVPCDVWRMDGGGFAWRLDVKAALCL